MKIRIRYSCWDEPEPQELELSPADYFDPPDEGEVGGQGLGRLIGRAHDNLPGIGVERLRTSETLEGQLGAVGRDERDGSEGARIEAEQLLVAQFLLGAAQDGETVARREPGTMAYRDGLSRQCAGCARGPVRTGSALLRCDGRS